MSAIGWRTLHGASNRVLADRLRDSKTVALGDMMGDRGGRQASLSKPIANVPCPLFRDWKLWPITEETAFEYGRTAAELRRIGRPIGQNDMMIAAIVLTLGNCTVVTTDSDLSTVPGLNVENWAS
jgi:hypothetical protein